MLVFLRGTCSIASANFEVHIVSESEAARFGEFGAKLKAYSPRFAGPVPPEDGARQLLKVIYASSLENGNGGTCVSYFGSTTKWL